MSTRNNKRTRGEDMSEGLKTLANARVEAAKMAASGAMQLACTASYPHEIGSITKKGHSE